MTAAVASRLRRLVFSRKGFDSGYGGVPSPIIDGVPVSLPIPSAHDGLTLGELGGDLDLASLVADLSSGRHGAGTRIHLDPDLDPGLQQRPIGWRPALGQTGAAQSHLAGQGIGPGDVFLFFGWFREAERTGRRWRHVRGAPHLHLLFGWLEVGEVLPVTVQRERSLARHPWIATHPHMANPGHYTDPRNTLYIAPETSALVPGRAGGGLFRRFSPALQLTCEGHSRSVWQVPAWLGPGTGPPLSYHADPARWTRHGQGWRLRTVAKGQEFVCQLEGREAALPWLASLLRDHT